MATLQATDGTPFRVESCDIKRVSAIRWSPSRRPDGMIYLMGRVPTFDGSTRLMSLHRFVMSASAQESDFDHIDGDGCNCERSNLRPASQSQNNANRCKSSSSSAPYKGITRTKQGKWRAVVGKDRRTYDAGTYASAEEAARAYDRKAFELHGEYARLNFPDGAIAGAGRVSRHAAAAVRQAHADLREVA